MENAHNSLFIMRDGDGNLENIESIHSEETQLELQLVETILSNIEETRSYVKKSTESLSRVLMARISEKFKVVDNERLQAILESYISDIDEEFTALFEYYRNSEVSFYQKHLNTADMIFNSNIEQNKQRIYLDNVMKKIDQRMEENIEAIFTFSNKGRVSQENNNQSNVEENSSMDEIFECLINNVVTDSTGLNAEGIRKLENLMHHYYLVYKEGAITSIKKCLSTNRSLPIIEMESIIGQRGIRNGKSRPVAIVEREIISEAQKEIEEMLTETVSKYREEALKKLKVCSSSIVDVIFRVLPEKYQAQRGLLEVIVDANVNERLVNLLDEELKKLTELLRAKNQDIVINEFYEDKGYKKFEDYDFNLGMVEKVYQEVLYDIRKCYNIQPDEQDQTMLNEIRKSYNVPVKQYDNTGSKRLDMIVSSECDSAKKIYVNLIDRIKSENQRNLDKVVNNMNARNQQAQMDNPLIKSENIVQENRAK